MQGLTLESDQMREGVLLYFAYGSNMLTERLQKRCRSARSVGNAVARGFSLSFAKRSKKDRSGKATLVRTSDGERAVYGVLFEICRCDQAKLDQEEGKGKGYDRDDGFTVVRLGDGREMLATTYLASPQACEQGLVPYDWYHALILAGACQHGLPAAYVAELRRTIVQRDLQLQRDSRQEALKILKCAGFNGLLEQGP